MNCEQVEELTLEGMPNAEAERHIRNCQRCAAFARVQRELDVLLRLALPAPVTRSGFDKKLHRRIRGERIRTLVEAYPELVPLAGGIAATALCVGLRPEWAACLTWIGAVATLLAALFPALADWLAGELEE